mmetsp:Transcript_36537/g.37934  ORF Transcript_36537/g.37934 Transcript_36537/m.37934 type:complete len:151 (+) Transcript_36537:3-455(+)
MKHMALSNIIILVLMSFSLPSIKADTTTEPSLVEKFKIRQIRKGISDLVPENRGHVSFYYKLYSLNKKGERELVREDKMGSMIGFNSMPQCFEYVLSHMNIQERVVFECPAEFSFTEDSYIYRYSGVETKKSYIVDLQLWNIGDVYTLVE